MCEIVIENDKKRSREMKIDHEVMNVLKLVVDGEFVDEDLLPELLKMNKGKLIKGILTLISRVVACDTKIIKLERKVKKYKSRCSNACLECPKPLNSSNSKNKNRRNYTNYQRPSAIGFPMAANLWHGALQLWAGVAHPGLLGTHPGSHQPPRPQAFMVQTPSSAAVPGFQGGYTPVSALHGGSSYGSQPYGSVPPGFGAAGAPPGFGAPGHFFSGIPAPPGAMWDQNALTAVFSAMSLTPPPSAEWYMDFGADSHMTSTTSNLLSSQPPSSSTPSSIIVGNRSLLPITSTSHTFFPTPNRPIHFSHILCLLTSLKF
jgi:hypothetical protein